MIWLGLFLWLAVLAVMLRWNQLAAQHRTTLNQLMDRVLEAQRQDAEERATMSVRLYVRTGRDIYVLPPERLLQETRTN